MEEQKEWRGSATELLKTIEETEIAPPVITKILNEYHLTVLKDNNIIYSVSRDKKGRQIILTKDDSDDSG